MAFALVGARAPFVSQPSAPETSAGDRLLYSTIKATYYKSKVAENNCPIWYNYLELVGESVDCPNAHRIREPGEWQVGPFVRGRASCKRSSLILEAGTRERSGPRSGTRFAQDAMSASAAVNIYCAVCHVSSPREMRELICSSPFCTVCGTLLNRQSVEIALERQNRTEKAAAIRNLVIAVDEKGGATRGVAQEFAPPETTEK